MPLGFCQPTGLTLEEARFTGPYTYRQPIRYPHTHLMPSLCRTQTQPTYPIPTLYQPQAQVLHLESSSVDLRHKTRSRLRKLLRQAPSTVLGGIALWQVRGVEHATCEPASIFRGNYHRVIVEMGMGL